MTWACAFPSHWPSNWWNSSRHAQRVRNPTCIAPIRPLDAGAPTVALRTIQVEQDNHTAGKGDREQIRLGRLETYVTP